MHDSKLIKLLRTLDQKTHIRLYKFAQSPYFNTSEAITRLVNYFIKKKCAPIYENNTKLQERVIFKFVYPKTSYSDQKMRTLKNKTLELVEQFIVIDKVVNDANYHEKSLLTHLSRYQLNTHYEQKRKEAQNRLDALPYSQNTFDQQLEINHIHNNHLSTQAVRGEQVSFEGLLADLDNYYLLSRLKYIYHSINRIFVVNVDFDRTLAEDILNRVGNSNIYQIPIVSLYHNMLYCILHTEKEETFADFLEKLKNYADQISKNELNRFYQSAENYCVYHLVRGANQYYVSLFDLYNMAIDNQLLYRQGKIRPANIKNIVTVGLRLEKFDWVAQFLANHRLLIDSTEPEAVYNYNMANLHFYTQDYDKTIDLLNNETYKIDRFFNMDSRILRIKIYYETQEVYLLQREVDNLYMFNYRANQIASTHQEGIGNFIALVKDLMNLPPYIKDAQKKKLQTKLESYTHLYERPWLQKKIAAKTSK